MSYSIDIFIFFYIRTMFLSNAIRINFLGAFVLSFLAVSLHSQTFFSMPSDAEVGRLPLWVQMMYAEDPNVWEVDAAYKAYYRSNDFEKTTHTQFYKHWRKRIQDFVQVDGSIVYPSLDARLAQRNELIEQGSRSGNWSLLGPIETFIADSTRSPRQNNVRGFAQSTSHPDILYAGTEPGEVYKSTDRGLTWVNRSLLDPLNGAVTAIAIHPSRPDTVLIGSGNSIFYSLDGGVNWYTQGLNTGECHEIQFKPSDPSIVFLACQNGFYRSTDGGIQWTNVFNERTYDVKLHTVNDDIVYLTKHNPGLNIAEFYRSLDGGLTYSLLNNGWHASTDPDVNDRGARLALTSANPDRIYAYLIGESKAGDEGHIGLYRSDDGGLTWTLPNGPAGGPYSDTHPNLANGSSNNGHHQGFYNCAVLASQSNPDEVLIGGTSLYKSYDAGLTFEFLGGYGAGSLGDIKVDMQDFRVNGNDVWVTTDGCVYWSDDFYSTTSHFEVRTNGMHSSDYWGFGQGWNEDVTVGGLYHCGVHASFDRWGQGNHLVLVGGEPASGYVNPGENRRVYSTPGLGRIVPATIGDPVGSFTFGINPNESYWTVESSELAFHPNFYSHAITGLDNSLWLTEDFGQSFQRLHTFGSNEDDLITYIEWSWSNPEVIYACQQSSSPSSSKLWKTEDGGLTWVQTALPGDATGHRKMLLQVDPINSDILYIAFESSNNRVYKSLDGGNTWSNLTTPTIQNERARWINLAYGTDGGIYYASNKTIFYRNNSMADWEDYGDGLPVQCNVNKAIPFYRDGKIRIASYGKGIWESPLYETNFQPIARIGLETDSFIALTCDSTSRVAHVVDLSVLRHAGASRLWEFPGGSPATSTSIEQDVVYSQDGRHPIYLTVTDASGIVARDTLYTVITSVPPEPLVEETFESTALPIEFRIENPDNRISWALTDDAGGFGMSSRSMFFDGFGYYQAGEMDDLVTFVDLSSTQLQPLSFDVAYARYAVNYSDTLGVLVSLDCGVSYDTLYWKGGSDLATRADTTEAFIPLSDEWRRESIDLSAYYGNEEVMLVFRGKNGFGNNIYIDNINFDARDTTTPPPTNLNDLGQDILHIYPNPVRLGDNISLATPSPESYSVDVLDMKGAVVLKSSCQEGQGFLHTSSLETGYYLVVLRSENTIYRRMISVE